MSVQRGNASLTAWKAGPAPICSPNLLAKLPAQDSLAALSVSRFMRRMADGGHTLLAAIHQPRAAIWSLFDKVSVCVCVCVCVWV